MGQTTAETAKFVFELLSSAGLEFCLASDITDRGINTTLADIKEFSGGGYKSRRMETDKFSQAMGSKPELLYPKTSFIFTEGAEDRVIGWFVRHGTKLIAFSRVEESFRPLGNGDTFSVVPRIPFLFNSNG